jgi:hypothetical protein
MNISYRSKTSGMEIVRFARPARKKAHSRPRETD